MKRMMIALLAFVMVGSAVTANTTPRAMKRQRMRPISKPGRKRERKRLSRNTAVKKLRIRDPHIKGYRKSVIVSLYCDCRSAATVVAAFSL